MRDPLDDLLDAASESLRDETAPGTESGIATRHAVFEGLRKRRRRKDWAMASALAFCVLFVTPTVWAHATGRLDALIAVVMNPPPAEQSTRNQPSSPRRMASAESAQEDGLGVVAENDVPSVEDPLVPDVVDEDEEEEVIEIAMDAEAPRPEAIEPNEPAEAAVSEALEAPEATPGRRQRARREVAESDEEIIDVRERELFEQAHRSHFDGGTPSQALRHWDDYLTAYPSGRYVPEARFNRALTLVRLGDFVRARRVLARFASGEYGASRRTQARELLELVEGELNSVEPESDPAER